MTTCVVVYLTFIVLRRTPKACARSADSLTVCPDHQLRVHDPGSVRAAFGR